MRPDFFAGLAGPVDFYLIRHGQSEGNAEKILQGRGEYPLSVNGRSQAAERGRSLKTILAGTPPGQILFFSSPQKRALETALIIAGEAGLPEPVRDDDLMEMRLGVWTGKTWDQVKNDDPALWADFMAHSWDAIPQAESSASLYRRALRAWAALRDAASAHKASKVIAVTHGGLIQWFIKNTLQCRNWFPLFPIANCGLFKLCVQPRPGEQNAYMCWEEINTIAAGRKAEPKVPGSGFPS
ncbi:MAG: histidine phosphatase family protein [Treponema sp.]|nr:histidine phosphatase family protein [Treponema sp.]